MHNIEYYLIGYLVMGLITGWLFCKRYPGTDDILGGLYLGMIVFMWPFSVFMVVAGEFFFYLELRRQKRIKKSEDNF